MKLLTSVLKSCSKQIWPEPAARTAVGLSNVKQPNPSVTNLNHLSDGIQKYLETFIISRGKKDIMNESNNFWTLEFSRELRMVIMVDVDIYRQYKLYIWVWVWVWIMVTSSGPSVVNTTQRIFMKMTTLTTIPDLYIDKVEDTRYISPLNYF